MAKFVIECPKCGKYAQANSGLFGFIGRTKTVNCACGYVIDVEAEKLSSRTCTRCGNEVVFDRSKGAAAKCPVCGQAINTVAEQNKHVEFSCAQCGVRLRAEKGTDTYTCPVCDHENNVAERVMNEELKKNGLASVIKYEGDNETLVWKHPIEDFCFGTQLIVHESQEAVFFRDGKALDLLGAGKHTLETRKLPLLSELFERITNTEGMFHSEIYYINIATQMGIRWGTDTKVGLFDPASGMHVEIGASGDFNIRVVDSRKLLKKVVGTADSLKQNQLLGNNGEGLFREMVMTQVKSFLAEVIRENAISILEIDAHLLKLSEALREKINPYFAEYGLELTEFFVSRVAMPDDDDFKSMKEQYGKRHLLEQEGRLRILKAQSDAEVLKIQKQAETEAYRMQAEAEAEEMRMKGYTYQQETARKVGMEAMQNGITGNGGAGGFGDVASLGVSLGALSSVMGVTKEAMDPTADSALQMGQALGNLVSAGWDCPNCGQKQVTSNFCPNCGNKKPEPQTGWNCACGKTGITSNFCPNCGNKKPAYWNCPCGKTGITSNFCPDCGKKCGDQ